MQIPTDSKPATIQKIVMSKVDDEMESSDDFDFERGLLDRDWDS
jgi:hypothetical protein